MSASIAPARRPAPSAHCSRRSLALDHVRLAKAQLDALSTLTDTDAEPSDVIAADLLDSVSELLTARTPS